jgi:hypothetical protein
MGKGLERATGIEPVTSSLGSWHSTAELRPLRVRQRRVLYGINTPLSIKSGVWLRYSGETGGSIKMNHAAASCGYQEDLG